MRKRKPSPPEEKGECAPLWIISFADMISLLMAFFVMLLTMSTARSGQLCNEGEGIFEKTLYGFRKSIEGFGLPGLFGTADEGLSFDSAKVYYPINDADDPGAMRTIDAQEERIRRSYRRLEGRVKTYAAQIHGSDPDFMILPITFAKGQSTLDDSARKSLNTLAAQLAGFAPVERIHLYVVGLAPDESVERRQWLLSARRAQTVADFLHENLPPETNCRIFSWGAGTGGDWVKNRGPISQNSQIAIAVLKPTD